MKKLVCTWLMCVVALVAVAQEREENRLGWNIALLGGTHFSAFENTKHASFGDCINGHVALSVGYDFSHKFGTRVEVSCGRNASGTNTKESGRHLILYHCNDVSVFADAVFNLSYLGTENRTNLLVEAKGYVGLGVAIPDEGTAPNIGYYDCGTTKTSPAMRLGVMGEWHVAPRWAFLLDGCVTGYADKFNGVNEGTALDFRMGLSFGVKYNF